MRNLPHGFDIYLVNVKTIRKIAQIFVAFSEKLNFRNKPKKCYLRKTLALLCLPRGVKLMTIADDLDERAQITSLIIQLDNCCQNRTQNSRFFSSTGYSFSESPFCSTLYQKKLHIVFLNNSVVEFPFKLPMYLKK